MVSRDFNHVPREWVEMVAEHNGEYPHLGMWGTCFIVKNFIGEQLKEKARYLFTDKMELEAALDLEFKDDKKEKARVKRAIAADDWGVLGEYVDEEMGGEWNVRDVDGTATAAYIHEVGGEWVVSINGAGWNFYDGVWDRIYDSLGLRWHDEETEMITKVTD